MSPRTRRRDIRRSELIPRPALQSVESPASANAPTGVVPILGSDPTGEQGTATHDRAHDKQPYLPDLRPCAGRFAKFEPAFGYASICPSDSSPPIETTRVRRNPFPHPRAPRRLVASLRSYAPPRNLSEGPRNSTHPHRVIQWYRHPPARDAQSQAPRNAATANASRPNQPADTGRRRYHLDPASPN